MLEAALDYTKELLARAPAEGKLSPEYTVDETIKLATYMHKLYAIFLNAGIKKTDAALYKIWAEMCKEDECPVLVFALHPYIEEMVVAFVTETGETFTYTREGLLNLRLRSLRKARIRRKIFAEG